MRPLTCCFSLLCLLLQFAGMRPLAAQNETPIVAIHGVAYDSLNSKPLQSATIRILGRPGLAVSDKKGKFRFDSIPPGDYTLVMEHGMLDSMGVGDVMTRATVVARRNDMDLLMAIPSFHTMWKRVCGDASEPSDAGIVFGAIRNAEHEQGMANTQVAVSWIDVGMGTDKKVRQTRFTLNTETDSSGTFVACGIPVDVPLQVAAGADSASRVVVELPSQNLRVLRRDLMLSDMPAALAGDSVTVGAVSGGSGTVRGRVLSVAGEPLENVRIGIDGVEVTRSNKSGDFIANNVHAGTRTVVFISIGSDPVSKIVDVPNNGVVTTSASMSRVTVLEDVVVRGEVASQIVKDFTARKRMGFGSIKDSTELMRYPSLESALRMSRGTRIDSKTHQIYMPLGAGYCLATVKLDRKLIDHEELLAYFPTDIAWIEVYPRWYDVPTELMETGSTCGLVAIFTKYAIRSR